MEKASSIRWPGFVQLFLLVIQAIYLILFFGDIGGFTNNLAFHSDLMFIFSFATCVLAFAAYRTGFFKNTLQQRILFAFLFLLHLAIASYSFYLTLATLVSRC